MAHRAHLGFTLALHRALATGDGNACWSPYSVASALGLTSQAARGDTRAELLELLTGDREAEFGKHAELLASAAALEPPRSASAEAPVLAVSNTLWAADELPLNPDFGVDLAGWPGAKVASAPFGRDPEGARKQINADVAETTRELIPELIPPQAIRPDTVAALVNALYLRVAWKHRFAEEHTEPAPFHSPGGAREVATMRQTEQLGYAARDGWQVVQLPAEGGVQAVVLLPDGELSAAEPTLDVPRLAELLDAPEPARVDLRMPKLDLGANAELTAPLAGLGVRSVFSPAADLTGLSPDPRLVVSSVLHESVLKLDEDGLEGAAATAVLMRLVSMPTGTPIEVRVDRPFLLLVRHAETGAVYFLCRVVEP
ncbi:MAG: serpin family protein [Pseudonocardiaceae bacterium]|nr:serpin family protein [Pseudonocardiaceae bacterium]